MLNLWNLWKLIDEDELTLNCPYAYDYIAVNFIKVSGCFFCTEIEFKNKFHEFLVLTSKIRNILELFLLNEKDKVIDFQRYILK